MIGYMILAFVTGLITNNFMKSIILKKKTLNKLMTPGIDGINNALSELRDLFNSVAAAGDDQKLLKRVIYDYILMKVGKIQSKLMKTHKSLLIAGEKDINIIQKKIGNILEYISDAIEELEKK